jgi:hypothetical protein
LTIADAPIAFMLAGKGGLDIFVPEIRQEADQSACIVDSLAMLFPVELIFVNEVGEGFVTLCLLPFDREAEFGKPRVRDSREVGLSLGAGS